MNNQHQSFVGTLTEDVAQQLIQDLFTGNTVEKSRIVKEVREVYQQRGGAAASDHEDTRTIMNALETMEEVNLVKKLTNSVWSIIRCIKRLDEFIDWVQLSSAEYLFRGVTKSTYEISASAYRRTEIGSEGEKQSGDFTQFVQINESLVADAKLRGYDERDGQELEDLEILAELQHFGAATGLIDFTRNALIALWFACRQDSGSALGDGKVFAVYGHRFQMIDPDLLKTKIANFFRNNDPQGRQRPLYQWEPAQRNNRIIAQQSIFLFGDSKIEPDKVCIIDGDSKREILESLQRVLGITEAVLFPDFDGFAHTRRQNIPFKRIGGLRNRRRANQAFRQNDYEKAITGYDELIDPDHPDVHLYYRRGLAKHGLQDYQGARQDFTNAINLPPNPKSSDVYSYHWRGNVNYLLREYEKAIADYDAALSFHVNPNAEYSYYWRGLANHALRRYEEAIVDLSKTIRLKLGYFYAYYMRGLAKFELGNFDEAEQDLQKASELAQKEKNTEYVEKIKQKLEEIKSGSGSLQ